MKPQKKYFMECHLAGCQYHDATEVWESLKIGTAVILEREPENRFDPNAVAVKYRDDETGDEYKIGYLPKGENEQIAVLMDMGWGDIFECRISQKNPEAHYEQRIHLILRVKQKPEKEA